MQGRSKNVTSFAWDSSLETGDREIDVHHQAFFVKAQEISDACRAGRGSAAVQEMVDFLTAYAKHHFRAEELRMEAIAYPYAGTHRAQHEELLEKIEAIEKRLQRKGASAELAEQVRETVVAWLLDHIKGSDVPLITLLKEKKVTVESIGPPPAT